jgi:hypothetical protein
LEDRFVPSTLFIDQSGTAIYAGGQSIEIRANGGGYTFSSSEAITVYGPGAGFAQGSGTSTVTTAFTPFLQVDSVPNIQLVNGTAVTINASALTMPTLLLDSYTSESIGAPFTAHLLPGEHILSDPAGYGGYLLFSVSNSGTVSPGYGGTSYASSIASVSIGNQLTVTGAAVTINATALTMPSLVLEDQSNESTSAPFTVHLLPGLHLLSNSSGSVTFSVDDNGNISFPSSEDALLSLQGSMTLIVKALK